MSHRSQTKEEEVVNAITHGLGVVFTFIAIPFLLVKPSKASEYNASLGIIMFGLGMLAVYLSSTLYHATETIKLKKRLHICDHVSIYFLIGGSYVPFVQAYTDTLTATIFLSIQWTIIIIGAVLKLFFLGKNEKISLLVYIVLGWSAIFLFKPFSANMPAEVFKWILIGGISYSIGVVFYRWHNQKYAHAVWHLFVLGGTVAHYIAIWKISDFISFPLK
jgi:hemolysin III